VQSEAVYAVEAGLIDHHLAQASAGSRQECGQVVHGNGHRGHVLSPVRFGLTDATTKASGAASCANSTQEASAAKPRIAKAYFIVGLSRGPQIIEAEDRFRTARLLAVLGPLSDAGIAAKSTHRTRRQRP